MVSEREPTGRAVYRCRASSSKDGRPLGALDTIVCPETLLRWHRQFVVEKWNFTHRRGAGRPGIMREISELSVRMARDNPRWGYTRIQGALANLKHSLGRCGTIATVEHLTSTTAKRREQCRLSICILRHGAPRLPARAVFVLLETAR